MIDVSELVTDPDFAQPFQVERFVGSFMDEGEYVRGEPKLLDLFGVVQPATKEDAVAFLPEGERQQNMIRVWCNQELRMSDGQGKECDNIIWQGQWHRVAFSELWSTQGYWFAIAVGFPHA